jgi:hypothetical protein
MSTILHLDQRTLCELLRECCDAPVPCHFESGSLSCEGIKAQATSFQARCIVSFKRLKDLATTCRFFRTSAWEGFLALVALLSRETSWTYSDEGKEPVTALMGTAAVHFAKLNWRFLLEGVELWLKEVMKFFERKEKEALLEEKEEEIKGLKRRLELALGELTFVKRQRRMYIN